MRWALLRAGKAGGVSVSVASESASESWFLSFSWVASGETTDIATSSLLPSLLSLLS